MSLIRFRCVRCQHPLKVEAEAVGKKLHCPVCYLELTVPAESTIKAVDPSRLYAADAQPLDVRDMQHRREFASLECRVCHTNIAVRKEQIGEEVVCPDCGTAMIVPPKIAEEIDARTNDTLDKIMLGCGNPITKNTYGVRDGDSTPLEDWSSRFPVYCKLCNTILYATEDQVGQELICPDCDTKTVVPPKPEKTMSTPQPSTFEGQSTFGIAKDASASREPLVPVVCELCGTRMYAAESEIGGTKTCPDCGRKTEIKAVPQEELVQPELSNDGGGDAYAINLAESEPPRPVARTITDYRYVDGSLDKEIHGAKQPEERTVPGRIFSGASRKTEFSDDNVNLETMLQRKKREKQKKRKKTEAHESAADVVPFRPRPLPKYPLTDGLFTPLLTWRVMLRVLLSTGLACGAILLGNLLPGLFIVVSLAFGGTLLMLWATLQTNYCWSVFHFSTDANDDFDEWFEFSLAGSLGLFFFIFCYSILAATPGYFFSSFFPGDLYLEKMTPFGQTVLVANSAVIVRDYFLMRLSHWIVFPFFFLSCMETDSFFTPVAARTFSTFARYTGIWSRYYGLVALFILLPEFVFVGVFTLASRFFDGTLLAVLSFLFGFFGVNFFTILYFRLLGRLAWVLEESVRQEESEEEES